MVFHNWVRMFRAHPPPAAAPPALSSTTHAEATSANLCFPGYSRLPAEPSEDLAVYILWGVVYFKQLGWVVMTLFNPPPPSAGG